MVLRSWMRVWLCFSPCWTLVGCTDDPPGDEMRLPGPSDFAGDWSGETEEGGPVSFVIVPAGITHMSLGFRLPDCEWSTELGFPEPVALQGGTFESQIEMSSGALRANVFVTFDTQGTGSGRIGYQLGGATVGVCSGAGQTAFTLRRAEVQAAR